MRSALYRLDYRARWLCEIIGLWEIGPRGRKEHIELLPGVCGHVPFGRYFPVHILKLSKKCFFVVVFFGWCGGGIDENVRVCLFVCWGFTS